MKKAAVVIAVVLIVLAGLLSLDPCSRPPADPDRPTSGIPPDDATDSGTTSPGTMPPPAAIPDRETEEVADEQGAHPPDDVVEVLVQDREGNPVEGAEVHLLVGAPLQEFRPIVVARGRSDGAGRLRLPARPAERHMLKVMHPDYAVGGDVEAFGGNLTEFTLPRGGSIAGRVTDEVTGRPVEAATVYIFDWCMLGKLHDWIVHTDAEGRYRVDGIGEGMLNVRAWSPEHALCNPTDVPAVVEGEVTTVDIPLKRGVRLHLRVLDKVTGRPVELVDVRYGYRELAAGSGRALTTVPVWWPGRGGIEITAPCYTGRYLLLDLEKIARPQDPIVVHLSPQIPVCGEVRTGSGDPAPGVTVYLYFTGEVTEEGGFVDAWGEAMTYAQGRFRHLSGPAGGTVFWEIRDESGGVRRGPRVAVAEDAEEVDLGTIVLDARHTLTGTVWDPDGRPVPRAVVRAGHVVEGRNLPIAECFVDPRGRYRLSGVPKGPAFFVLGAIDGWPDRRKSLEVTGDAVLDWKLERGHRIAGRVLDADGLPKAAIWVYASPGGAMARTRADGSFEFHGLGRGPYKVSAYHAKGPAVEGVFGNTHDVELVLPPEK